MDYNKEFEKLIEKARKDGYEYCDGEFIDVDSNEDLIVLSVRSGSVINDNYTFEIFDKVYPLTDKQIKKILTLDDRTPKKEIEQVMYNLMESLKDEDWQNCRCGVECLFDYKDISVDYDFENDNVYLDIDFIYYEAHEIYLRFTIGKVTKEEFKNHKTVHIITNSILP